MKILHLLASNRYSGAENVVCQIINMFHDDPDIEMVYCSRDGQIRDVLAERNIIFVPIENLTIREVKRVIKKQQPDIIHAHDFRTSIIAACSTGKIPIISHLHNNAPWLKKHGVKTLLFAATCKKYASILTVSNSVFDEFVYGNKYRHKLKVIYNPIDTKTVFEKAMSFESDTIYDIGYCGRLTRAKNPELFLNIISAVQKQIPNIKVAIIGDGELRAETESNIKEKNLIDNITMYGFLSNPYKVMKNFKILIMPSLWEGFGLVAVEAMALGVPVVCSGVGGLHELVNDSCGKICTDEGTYVEEVIKLLNDEVYRAEKSMAAKEQGELLDNLSQYKASLLDEYKSVRKYHE